MLWWNLFFNEVIAAQTDTEVKLVYSLSPVEPAEKAKPLVKLNYKLQDCLEDFILSNLVLQIGFC